MLREREDLPFRDLVEALRGLCRTGATGFMFIQTDCNHSARIGLSNGAIRSVNFGRAQGQDAIDALKEINWGRFTFSEVDYQSPSRKPLPSTAVVLAQLAEQTWARVDQSLGTAPAQGFAPSAEPAPAGRQEPGGGGTHATAPPLDVEAEVFAAARRGLGEADGPAPDASPEARPARGLRRLFGGRGRAAAADAPADSQGAVTDDALLAQTLFGASRQDLEDSRRERVDGALAADLFAPAQVRDANQEAEDAIARDLFAGAGGPAEASGDSVADAHAWTDFAEPDAEPAWWSNPSEADASDPGEPPASDPIPAPLAGPQRVFGRDLVNLITRRLADAIGPFAPMAVAEVEPDLMDLEGPDRLATLLLGLTDGIEDPREAEAFRAEVMGSVFG